MAVYWIGANGNVYVKGANGVQDAGKLIKDYGNGFDAERMSAEGSQIADPVKQKGSTTDTTPTNNDTAAPDPDAALRDKLKGRISGRGNEIDDAYSSLFSALDELVKSRGTDLEKQYGDQLKGASDSYAEALPQIDQSYAALGSYDSTQRGDARGKARTGFESTTKTIGDNKKKDESALGQYKREQAAKFKADQESAKRAIDSSADTTDVDALRELSNKLDDNLSQTGVTRATLGTDGQAAKELSGITKDNGRYEAAVNALDSILKSSMASDMKEAAVTAITTSAGLSDAEKKKVQAQYGNTYAEQAAL